MFIEERGRILSEHGEVMVESVSFQLELTGSGGARRTRWGGYADLPRGSRKRLSTLEVYRIELDSGTWGLARFPTLLSDQEIRVVGKGALHFSP